jgi:HEPN domain-containing protein
VKPILGTNDNQFRFAVWLSQANHDLDAAAKSMEAGYYEWACFQAEQAAEKALKSGIVYNGKSAPKLHRLGVLIGILKSMDQRFRGIHIDIADLQSYTFTARYPFLIPGNYETPHDYITLEDADKCIKASQIIINLMQELLHV